MFYEAYTRAGVKFMQPQEKNEATEKLKRCQIANTGSSPHNVFFQDKVWCKIQCFKDPK
jgi:hypothetical protein